MESTKTVSPQAQAFGQGNWTSFTGRLGVCSNLSVRDPGGESQSKMVSLVVPVLWDSKYKTQWPAEPGNSHKNQGTRFTCSGEWQTEGMRMVPDSPSPPRAPQQGPEMYVKSDACPAGRCFKISEPLTHKAWAHLNRLH